MPWPAPETAADQLALSLGPICKGWMLGDTGQSDAYLKKLEKARQTDGKQCSNEENLAYVDDVFFLPKECGNYRVTLHNGASITPRHANICTPPQNIS